MNTSTPDRSAGAHCLSFRRIVDNPFDACMAALESWRLTGHDGELYLGKSLLRGPVERDHRSGIYRFEVRLARGPLRPGARMRLDVEQWSCAGTALELIPCQRVRPSTGCFRAGHRLLDLPDPRAAGARADPAVAPGPVHVFWDALNDGEGTAWPIPGYGAPVQPPTLVRSGRS
jgi:hypothetical protein